MLLCRLECLVRLADFDSLAEFLLFLCHLRHRDGQDAVLSLMFTRQYSFMIPCAASSGHRISVQEIFKQRRHPIVSKNTIMSSCLV